MKAELTAERVLELLELALEAEQTFPPEVFTWLQGALRAHVESLGARSPADCLGFTVGRGERSIARRLRASRRDAALLDAWRIVAEGAGELTLKHADVLESEMAGFRSSFWLTWKKAGGPPAGTSALRSALYDLCADEPDAPPAAARVLYDALRRICAKSAFAPNPDLASVPADSVE